MGLTKEQALALASARARAQQAQPTTGDTLIDLGTNLVRGASQGFAGLLPEPMRGPLEAAQAAGLGGVPWSRLPPVGEGVGYRTGQSIGRTVPSLPLGGAAGQLAIATLGGGAAEAVQGATGSATAGDLTELGIGLASIAAPLAVRRAFGAGQGAAQAEVADQAITGVNMGAGPITQGRTAPDTLQSFAEKVPGGRGVMQDFARKVQDDFRAAVDRFTGLLGRHAQSADDLRAGIRIQRDIRGARADLDARMGAITQRINVRPESPVDLASTAATLQRMGGRATGVEALDALATTPTMRAGAQVIEAGGLPPISYEQAIRLRARIGERLKSSGLVTDISKGELKALYGALSDDLGRTVETEAGPAGKRLWDQSRRLWRREMRRFEDDLERIADMVDPARAAEIVSRSPRTLHIIRRTVSPETYDTLVAATFNDLGRAVNSAQNATGTVWSLESFLSRWNALGAQSREALLAGPRYARAREGLNALARQAERVREINQRIVNQSGTARGVADIATAGAPLAALAAGKVWPAVAAAMAIGGSYGAAKLMTRPEFVRWLGTAYRVPRGQVGGLALRLSGMIREGGWTPAEATIAADAALRLQEQQ